MLTHMSNFFWLKQLQKMIEVVCNDRLGKKVRIKCKYPSLKLSLNDASFCQMLIQW